MKGVIVECVRKMVSGKYSLAQWKNILEKSGVPASQIFLASQDVDDAVVLKIFTSSCSVLGVSLSEFSDMFGEYWMLSYAPAIYPNFFTNVTSSKDFLLNMNSLHAQITKKVPNAKPPQFEHSWKDNNTLLIKYNSSRNLIDVAVGLVKGVGKYFKENIVVKKLDNYSIQIVFP